MVLGQFVLDGVILCSDVATGCAFLSVFQRIRLTGSAEGLSLQTMIAAVSIRCLHLASYTLNLHYHPVMLPHQAFLFMDWVNAIIGLACLVSFCSRLNTYEREKDNFGIQVFDSFDCFPNARVKYRGWLAASFLYSIIAVLGLTWHHARRWLVQEALPDTFGGYYMSFYETTAALCLIPQLWMFHQDKRVPPLLANFVIFFAMHKVLVLIFWASYPWVNGTVPPNRNVQMAFDFLSVLILSDFLYYWARSKLHGYDEVILDTEIPLSSFSSLQHDEAYLGCEALG